MENHHIRQAYLAFPQTELFLNVGQSLHGSADATSVTHEESEQEEYASQSVNGYTKDIQTPHWDSPQYAMSPIPRSTPENFDSRSQPQQQQQQQHSSNRDGFRGPEYRGPRRSLPNDMRSLMGEFRSMPRQQAGQPYMADYDADGPVGNPFGRLDGPGRSSVYTSYSTAPAHQPSSSTLLAVSLHLLVTETF